MAAVALAALTARVEGTSMQPTLHDGDFLLVDRLGPRLGPPSRGDIVVVGLNANGLAGVKRVIGVPGDQVAIDGTYEDAPGGRPHPVVLLRLGGTGPWQRLVEPYIAADWGRPEFCCDADGLASSSAPRALTLPAGEYFVLGDNRGVSIDSRAFGLVPRERILARIVARYWPLTRTGPLVSNFTMVPSYSGLDGLATSR